MDEFDRGMEPEVRRYLKKVLNTLFVGLFWMIFMAFLGLYFGWAIPFGGHVDGFNIAFYILFAVSLAGLVWYYWRIWK
ncbi:MAG: hypothetical protein EOO08_01610 [Chitinophagaceae bacterium]|nr:MAG: hypothetical protein EOO08_01610 [Chitinophagaceae bacterium]